MKNQTVKVTARFDILLAKVGLIVDEGHVDVELNREQYDRIKASFDTGEYKLMNEDCDILDLYTIFNEAGRGADNQVLLVDYPEAIKEKLSFDEAVKAKKKSFKVVEFANEMQAIIDERGKNMRARLDAGDIEDELARYDALEELQYWMEDRGLDKGEMGYPLLDEEGWVIEQVDMAWEHGFYGRKGYTKPVALQFYRTTPELLEMARARGYEVFESIEELKAFVEKYCLGR